MLMLQEQAWEAVLTQQGGPIAFMSRVLGTIKWAWSTYAKETLAIIQAIQTWRPYLFGQKFFIQTDKRSLKYFFDECFATLEQEKWVPKLLGYDYDIIYKPGRGNNAADALSRVAGSPPSFCLKFSYGIQSKLRQRNILTCRKLVSLLRKPSMPYAQGSGLVCFKNKLAVPCETSITQEILQKFHYSPMGGHSGVLRTYKRIAQQY